MYPPKRPVSPYGSTFDKVDLASGVALKEKRREKKGAEREVPVNNKHMTRSNYEKMTEGKDNITDTINKRKQNMKDKKDTRLRQIQASR
jgi:hypothetical protein